MRAELESKLADEFVFMRVKEYDGGLEEAARKNLYHAFGCEVDDGWYNLIYDMCCEIRDELDDLGFEQEDFIVEQVKEKYAGLRFYWSLINDDSDDWSNYDAIRKIVSKYESMSMETCEICGKPGKVTGKFWVKTLCDEHAIGYGG